MHMPSDSTSPVATASVADDHSEHFFQEIVALAADAIVATDADQHIVLFNRGAEDIFGYRADEVLGQPLEMLLPERAAKAHREHDIPSFERSGVTARRMAERTEVYGRRKSGEEFPLEAAMPADS